MPKGPKGQKRPADVIGNAIKVAKIATGEVEEDTETNDSGKSKAAQEMGRMGGQARADNLSAAERKAIARKAAKARWKKDQPVQGKKART